MSGLPSGVSDDVVAELLGKFAVPLLVGYDV